MKLSLFGLAFVSWLSAGCDSGTIEDGGGGGGGSTSTSTSTSKANATSNATSSSNATTKATANATASGSTGAGDPLEVARQTCVDKINQLRATKGRAPYGRWSAAEACVDDQATSDEASGQAHGAWSGGEFPSCNGNAQNECLGGGVAGIEGCLEQMWAEGEQAGCAGCDACADAYDPNCPNCDFFGDETGDTCGHYVNMSANYFTEVACGFSDGGGWAAQNFH